jgi:hypothetical protein
VNLRIAISLLLPLAASAEVKIEPVENQPDFSVEWDGATDLSGITWIKDDRFMVVSNRVKGLFPLTLKVDLESGRVSDAGFGKKISVKTEESDFEGLVYMGATNRFFVSTENRSRIVGFNLDEESTFKVEVPKIFKQTRQNKSLESLAWNDARQELWTANEDALDCDGSTSGRENGALVRLQKFDSKLEPAAQFAYRTEPSIIRIGHQGTGVTDLALLPNGDLLVLERVLTVGFCVKIFRVEFGDATDISGVDSLEANEDFKPVKKHLLFEKLSGMNNFEGMTVGPKLADGSFSVLLVADNGGGSTHHFMPLKLRIEEAKPEPKPEPEKKPKAKKTRGKKSS